MVEAKIKKSHYSCRECALQRACRFPGCVKKDVLENKFLLKQELSADSNDTNEPKIIPVTDEYNYNQDIFYCSEHSFRKHCHACDEVVDDETANTSIYVKSYHGQCMDRIRDNSFKCVKFLDSHKNIDIVRLIIMYISGTNFINL